MERVKRILTSVFVIGIGSITGMFVGAFLMYWFGMGVYMTLREIGIIVRYSGPMAASEECSRGNGIAWLCILFGAFTGIGLGWEWASKFLEFEKQEPLNKLLQ